MKKLLKAKTSLLLSGVAASTLLFTSAYAQETETTTAPDAVEAPAAEDTKRMDRVVVTGSLLRRDEFTSTSPIQVITAEVATLEGLVDTAEIIQGSSVAAGSVQLNNQFGGFVVEGGTGINSVSLRGLGANRSLVLLNGRRPGPAGTRGQVGSFDLNVLPSSVITRVDILKDGASSIYGSDAVAGVVNVITRTSIDRPEVTVQYNQPVEGGGESLVIDGAYGLNFDKGNIVLAAQYTKRKDLSIGDRDYLSCPNDNVYDATTGENIDREDRSIQAGTNLSCSSGNVYHNTIIDLFTGDRYIPSPDGVTIGGLEGYRPRANGRYDDAGGVAFYEDVINSEYALTEDAYNAMDLLTLYGSSNFEFDVLGGITWDTELLYSSRKTKSEGWRQFFPIIADASLAGSGYGYLNADGTDSDFTNPLGSLVQPVAIAPSNSEINVDYYNLATGVDGTFGGLLPDWTWSLDAVTSKSKGTYGGNQILVSKSGDWNYNYGIEGPGYSFAPTYDLFTPEALSGADMSWYDAISSYEEGETTYEQSLFTAVASGPIFELPAGEVGLAVGFEAREFSIDDQPSEASINGDLWGSSSALVTKGEDDVVEYFAELEVPILKGVPGFEELSFNGSARTFNYASYGTGDVWKAGLNWQVIPSVRFRGSKGTSYRAPALYELYLGSQTSFLSQSSIDPCIDWGNSTNANIRTNCAADGIPDDYNGAASSATITSGGGAGNLKAETSESETIGVIFTPTFADLSIAIDYFSIEVNDQVSSLGAGAILGGCYGANNFPNAFCDLFTRTNDPANALAHHGVATVTDSFLNVNQQKTSGFDYTIRYNHDFDFGSMVFELQATQTTEDIALLFDSDAESGFDTDDFSGTIGDPEWVGNGRVSIERGDWTYSWLFDYIHETSNAIYADEFSTYFGRAARYIVDADSTLTHDLSVRYQNDDWSIVGGFLNVFDEDPPYISTGVANRRGNIPLSGGYDLRGRTAFVTVNRKF
ncbi:TonB-dependent receptor domain-containing protein [Hirschia baltica]|uniref:TonB-dependent receptor n=1 Tax=Hirschia baltica (strain ATCC 49814 / DSM 5838 / IFAM 1418) TaxID=582402 RepID=C6XQ67_HIRBI|nr:TonB-dependent receptor [Hirschia baltica]ACT58584.1 TonB-dependent receptor [Hirschia baltica ATCC 49814]